MTQSVILGSDVVELGQNTEGGWTPVVERGAERREEEEERRGRGREDGLTEPTQLQSTLAAPEEQRRSHPHPIKEMQVIQ